MLTSALPDSDLVLLIPGEDGRNNAGSYTTLKWLCAADSHAQSKDSLSALFHFDANGNGTRVDHETGTLLGEMEILEDCIIGIRKVGSGECVPLIFPGVDAAGKTLWEFPQQKETFGLWDNALQYGLPASVVAASVKKNGPDEMEIFKVRSFLDMVDQVRTAGNNVSVPLSAKASDKFIREEVESWPLCQAYGLEETGRQGFFTMNHKVVGCLEALDATMRHVDAQCVKDTVFSSLSMVNLHWSHTLQRLDRLLANNSVEQVLGLSEEDLSENLALFYDHGKEGDGVEGVGARALIGTNTARVVSTEVTSSDDVKVGGSGVVGLNATHFTMEATDPSSGAFVARTYFLSCGSLGAGTHLAVETDDGNAEAKDGGDDDAIPWSNEDCLWLMQLYAFLHESLGAAAATALEALALGKSLDHCTAAATAAGEKAFLRLLSKSEKEEFAQLSTSSPFHARVSYVDALGGDAEHFMKSCNLPAGLHQRHLVVIQCSLIDIPSKELPEVSCGGLTVGDTFVPSASDTVACVTGSVLFPRMRVWRGAGEEEDAFRLVDRVVNHQPERVKLGAVVEATTSSGGRSRPLVTTLILPNQFMPVVHGKLKLFEDGFVFGSAAFPHLILSISRDVHSLRIFDVEASNFDRPQEAAHLDHYTDDCRTNAILLVRLKKSSSTLADSLAFELGCEYIAFPLLDNSVVRDKLVAMLSGWKERLVASADDDDEVATTTTIPSELLCGLVEVRCSEQKGGDGLRGVPGMGLSRNAETSLRSCSDSFFKASIFGFDLEEDVLQLCLAHDGFLQMYGKEPPFRPPQVQMLPGDAEKIPVVAIFAPPGNEGHRLTSWMMGSTAASVEWGLVTIGSSILAPFASARVRGDASGKEIRAAIDDALSALTDTPSVQQLLIHVEAYVDPSTLFWELKDLFTSGPLHMLRCISAVSLSSAFIEERGYDQTGELAHALPRWMPIPSLFEQCTDVIDTVVLLRCGDTPVEFVDLVKSRLQIRNPKVAIVRCRAAHIESLEPAAFVGSESSSAGGLPLWNRPPAYRSLGGLAPSPEALNAQEHAVPLIATLDRARLLTLLKGCFPKATVADGLTQESIFNVATTADAKNALRKTDVDRLTAGTSTGNIWMCHGLVQVEDAGEATWVELTCSSRIIRLAYVDADVTKVVVTKKAQSVLVFHGRSLVEESLQAIVATCLSKSARKLERVLDTDLSPLEIGSIRDAYMKDMVLPDGYFFDGTCFVDQWGHSSRNHPQHQQFVQDYIGIPAPSSVAAPRIPFVVLPHS
jgi:hypothetical protein